MAWIELQPEEFEARYSRAFSCFGTRKFNQLNASKVEKLHFLSYELDTPCLGIVFGEKDGLWKSPFSAPFGGFTRAKNVTMEVLQDAIRGLCELAKERRFSFRIVQPPVFYDQTFYAKVVAAMGNCGVSVSYTDINYAFDYRDCSSYENRLHHMGKRNLKQVQKMNYRFERVTDLEDKKIAHQIIQQHYKAKGYPLWMSLEALDETSKIIPIDFFLLKLDDIPVSATIIYRVTEKIAQMIYWGALPEYWDKRPLNYLAREMFECYRSLKMDFLDLGPASLDGNPSNGLCTFKESVGCFADLKYAFYFDGKKI